MDSYFKDFICPQLQISSKMEEISYVDKKFIGMMVSFPNYFIAYDIIHFSKKWDTSLG